MVYYFVSMNITLKAKQRQWYLKKILKKRKKRPQAQSILPPAVDLSHALEAPREICSLR